MRVGQVSAQIGLDAVIVEQRVIDVEKKDRVVHGPLWRVPGAGAVTLPRTADAGRIASREDLA